MCEFIAIGKPTLLVIITIMVKDNIPKKIITFWDTTPGSLIDWYEGFDKIYCPPLQGVRWDHLVILIWYYQITRHYFSER